jgi:protoporphyrinogen oxidase
MVGTHGYDGKTILYVGKYLETHDSQFAMTAPQLIKLYQPFLEKLSPHFMSHVTASWVFKAPFAQPIVEIGHGQKVPTITTPMKHVFWSSMQHIYPWDRGTNYAVRLGRKAATIMNS